MEKGLFKANERRGGKKRIFKATEVNKEDSERDPKKRVFFLVHWILFKGPGRLQLSYAEVCKSVKRDLLYGKRDLFIWQKRPINISLQLSYAGVRVKRDLLI